MLLLLVVATRLLLALLIWSHSGPGGFMTPDTSSYAAPAESLLHGSFSSYDGQAEIFRTPGYPLFLLPAVTSGHFALVVFLENLILSVFSAWFIFRIARETSPLPAAGTWAVVFFACEFLGILYSGKALSETLFCAQFLLFVWLFLRFFRRPNLWPLTLAALALGWATYTRPVGLYLGPLLALALALLPRGLALKQRLLRAFMFPLVLGLTLAPWFARNIKAAGYPGFAAVGDYVLYFYSSAAVEAKYEHKGLSQVQEELGFGALPYIKNEPYFKKHPEQRAWSQGQIIRYWHGETRRIIAAHPISFFLVHMRGCATVLIDPGATELLKTLHAYPEKGGLMARSVDQGFVAAAAWLLREHPWTVVALLAVGLELVAYYGIALLGLRLMPKPAAILFLVLAAYLVLVAGGPAATGRYRLPIMPLLSVSAGIAAAHWRAGRKPAASTRSTNQADGN